VTSVVDAPRPGQACRVVNSESIAAVEALAMENCRASVVEIHIAEILNVSHGSAHHVIDDVLQFHKVSAWWVPWQLTPELKRRRVDACSALKQKVAASFRVLNKMEAM
jgi:hypothetical protein